MASERGVIDMVDAKESVEKRFDTVKYLSWNYRRGRWGGDGCSQRCEGLGSNGYDGNLRFRDAGS